MKRPAFQFYPADWRKDMALQSCSVAARGLWVDILCIAHECEPYGHLTVNGKPMTAAQIGRHTGLTQREAEKLLAELADAGVSSTTDEGAVFSRRMVRDEDLRNRRAEGGKAGSEHGIKGAEHGAKGGRPKKARGVSKPPLEPPPSSSSSTSVGSVPNGTGGEPPPDGEAIDPKRELYLAGKSLLHRQGMPKAQCGSFITKLATDYGNDNALEAVRSAVSTQPLEAAAYLKATCQRLKGERRDPVTVPSDAAEKSSAYLREQAEHAANAVPPPPNLRALVRKLTSTAA